jgi:hypothetical protein
MQAAPRRDIGLAAENARGVILDVHQLVKTELAPGVIEKQVDVGILRRFIPSRRAEEIQVLDPESLELGLVGPQPGDGFLTLHGRP